MRRPWCPERRTTDTGNAFFGEINFDVQTISYPEKAMNKIWMNVLCVCVCVLSLSICVIEMDMVGANCAELPRFSDYYYQCVDVRNGTTRWWTWTTVANVGWRRRPTIRSCSPRLFYQRRPRSIHNVSAVHRFGHDWNI